MSRQTYLNKSIRYHLHVYGIKRKEASPFKFEVLNVKYHKQIRGLPPIEFSGGNVVAHINSFNISFAITSSNVAEPSQVTYFFTKDNNKHFIQYVSLY